jgi:hypothetical protein
MPAMDNASNVIDLAARRAERLLQSPKGSGDNAPLECFSGEALKERQRETIEKLRALGYEMCHKRRK